MVYRNYDELISHVKSLPVRKRMVVACANDDHSVGAALDAAKEGIVRPVLVGEMELMKPLVAAHGAAPEDVDLVDCTGLQESCALAVQLIREGKGDFLMKGKVDTSVFLKEVVNKQHGLGRGGIMSHVTMFEVSTYHKLILAVDGGMVTYPTLEQKKAIIENTVRVLHRIGYECPKVGVLACKEKVDPKLPETLDGRALQEMNERGEITGCIVEGPISYDCALDKEIADFKGYESKIAGDADVLLAPNIHAGNIMGKMYTITAKARMAGIIEGAKCPIIMTSRGSSEEEKYLSIVLAAAQETGAE